MHDSLYMYTEASHSESKCHIEKQPLKAWHFQIQYIYYSKSVKPGITRIPWSFQGLHEISIIKRDFMKSLFISSDYMKSLKKQALNFILLQVNFGIVDMYV